MKTLIVIPARFKSSRFPGKPLAKIKNKEMIIWVAQICKNIIGNSNIIIATDHLRIKKVVNNYGFKAIMTSKNCSTGTDRVAEVSKKIKADIYINVQGDEPTIKAKDLKKIISAKIKFPNHVICGYTNLSQNEKPTDTNIPKVLINSNKDLIYMSRLPLPGKKNFKKNTKIKYFKQVCIYAFNKDELKKFKNFKKKSVIEIAEDIEILRFFEINKKIKMIKTTNNSIAVDQKKDIKKVEKYLKNEKKN